MTDRTIELILYGCSIFFPSLITILAIAKKTYFNNALRTLAAKIDEQIETNQECHLEIKDNLDDYKILLTGHSDTLELLLRERTVAQRVRQVIKHAIDFCANFKIGKVLNNSSQELICFATDILDIGLDNITNEQLNVRFWAMRETCAVFGKQVLGDQLWQEWYEYIQPSSEQFLEVLIVIKEDTFNTKEQRFLTKLDDFTQTTARQFIMFLGKRDFK